MKATALVHPNIALVKYWGKRDIVLNLPENGSISVNLGGLETKTTFEFGDFDTDVININNEDFSKDLKLIYHIERIKKFTGIMKKVKIFSESNFPKSAGIASSASGLAALTISGCAAASKELSEKELTILSRQGSGSSARSIPEGFVELYKGENSDGSDCFAESIFSKDHWKEFRIIVAIVSDKEKKTSSTKGMEKASNSDFYKTWLDNIKNDRDDIFNAIKNKDIIKLGEVAENNAIKMHSIMMTSKPSIFYWVPNTLEIINSVKKLRDDGIDCYFTIDAGPQVKILCLEKNVNKVLSNLENTGVVKKTVVCVPGSAGKIINEHLF